MIKFPALVLYAILFRCCKRQTLGKILWFLAFLAFPISLSLPIIAWALYPPLLGIFADATANPFFGSFGLLLGIVVSFFVLKMAPKSIYIFFALSWAGTLALDILRCFLINSPFFPFLSVIS